MKEEKISNTVSNAEINKSGTEDAATNTKSYKLEFFGKGSEFFKITIVNWLLTLITLGIYFPWARVKQLKYIYGQTSLNNERFHYSGTGWELFLGFIKAILLFIAWYFIIFLFGLINPIFAIIFIILSYVAIPPFFIHGSLKYSMSRTSYRGVRFGYRGNRGELIVKFLIGTFLTIITLGLYSSWFSMNIRKYTHENFRYGDIEFSNDCNGSDFFWIIIKGYFLTLITFGIYSFWFNRDLFNYYWNNLKMKKDEKNITCRSTATAGGFFELILVNLLIIIFTLGIGLPWVQIRTNKFICDNVKLKGDIDIDTVLQTEEEYIDATGEEAIDVFGV
ncbi:MAG: hypothetical protein CMD02_04085 [Flavobacteriales bacterium]|nr:hypothetical protein [Flavobacteriales bacterium]|tara:strand:- start:3168 stop:4169 length:1002 start_codon:yes stop_codon:yes gene_type:complete